jgi:hypothetical protein
MTRIGFGRWSNEITGKRLTYKHLTGKDGMTTPAEVPSPVSREAEGLIFCLGPRLRGLFATCSRYSFSRRCSSSRGTDKSLSTVCVNSSNSGFGLDFMQFTINGIQHWIQWPFIQSRLGMFA